jgi:hypothetical protein
MFSCRRRQTRIHSQYSRVRNAYLGGTECRPDGGLHASCKARREGTKSLFQEGHQTSRPVTEDHHAWWLSSHTFRPPRAARQMHLAMRPSQPHTPSCPMSGQCVRSARTLRWARWGKRRMARSRCLVTHSLTHARTIYLGGFVSQDPKYGGKSLPARHSRSRCCFRKPEWNYIQRIRALRQPPGTVLWQSAASCAIVPTQYSL